MRSFRLRLAAISVIMSGLVLLAFGAVSWLIFQRVGVANLDEELQNFGFRVAGRAGPNVSGPRTETNMAEVFGVESARARFFSLVVQGDRITHRTDSWPRGLDPVSFQGGVDPLDPQPELVDPPPRPAAEVEPGRPNPPPARVILEPRYYTVSAEGARYRVGVFSNGEVRIVLGADLAELGRGLHQIRRAFLIALPGALFIVALGAAFVGRRALRPIEVLSDRMENVSAEGLDQRIKVERTDLEFKRIIDAYNVMMGRLEKSFHQATRFSADASHELKTPLAVMQGTLERALAKCPDESEAQQVYSDLLEEVGNQRAILESLLLLSRADAGELKLSREEVDLSKLVETLVEDASLLAEGRGITVESEIAPGIRMEADAALLQRVLHNLFSNAVKYNRDGGQVKCALSRIGDAIEFTVANTGAPIPREEHEKIFDRFYRSGDAGNSRVEGVGLGLSLAREIVAAHGGEILVADDAGEGMTVFVVRLR